MLRDAKWLRYALDIIRAVDDGASSIAEIADEVDGSQSYIAKVVAALRRDGMISKDYELLHKPSDISVKYLVGVANSYDPNADPIEKISAIMLDSLDDVGIDEVW